MSLISNDLSSFPNIEREECAKFKEVTRHFQNSVLLAFVCEILCIKAKKTDRNFESRFILFSLDLNMYEIA